MTNIKEEIQTKGLTLTDSYSNILYEWATGIGKSLMAIKIIEKSNENWNIVLAETIHEQNWRNEFKEHNKEYLLNKVKFFCYASLHKYIDSKNYIFDEVHHIFSDKRINLLQQIYLGKAKKLICLSATLTKRQKEQLQSIIGKYYTYTITLSKAIDLGILPEPTVYFIGVELDTTNRYCKFNFNKDKFVMCTEREMYDRMSDRVEYLKQKFMSTREEFAKIKWLSSANTRKKFLSECKTKYAKILLNNLKDKRLICFTGSIKQSEELSHGLSVHSKIGKDLNESMIESFNNGEINKLFATGMLREGVNLSNIEVGIIIQLDNTERYFTQIHGRTLRSLYPEQYVMYVKGTQDEVYVQTAIKDFNEKYIKFISL